MKPRVSWVHKAHRCSLPLHSTGHQWWNGVPHVHSDSGAGSRCSDKGVAPGITHQVHRGYGSTVASLRGGVGAAASPHATYSLISSCIGTIGSYHLHSKHGLTAILFGSIHSITISLLAAHRLSWAHYSYTLPASVAHLRYIRPPYFVEENTSRFTHPECPLPPSVSWNEQMHLSVTLTLAQLLASNSQYSLAESLGPYA